MAACAVESCPKPARNAGLCWSHYQRRRRHGDPLGGNAANHEPLEVRVMRGLPADRTPDGCWEWTRGCATSGYGVVTLPGGGSRHAHRVVYELMVGPIPEGMEPDHLCKNKPCVNPAHLEPVTRSENVRRGWPDRKARAVA